MGSAACGAVPCNLYIESFHLLVFRMASKQTLAKLLLLLCESGVIVDYDIHLALCLSLSLSAFIPLRKTSGAFNWKILQALCDVRVCLLCMYLTDFKGFMKARVPPPCNCTT